MIVRMWRGAVRVEDAEAYAAYIDETGMAEYGRTARDERVAHYEVARTVNLPG